MTTRREARMPTGPEECDNAIPLAFEGCTANRMGAHTADINRVWAGAKGLHKPGPVERTGDAAIG